MSGEAALARVDLVPGNECGRHAPPDCTQLVSDGVRFKDTIQRAYTEQFCAPSHVAK